MLGNGQAMRYGIGVGREGFTWAGTKTVEKKAEWPDWTPAAGDARSASPTCRASWPAARATRSARAPCTSRGSVYRIHGTNAPDTIGQRVSSGCIRLTNEDVDDLYSRVKVGTKVVVLPMSGSRTASR